MLPPHNPSIRHARTVVCLSDMNEATLTAGARRLLGSCDQCKEGNACYSLAYTAGKMSTDGLFAPCAQAKGACDLCYPESECGARPPGVTLPEWGTHTSTSVVVAFHAPMPHQSCVLICLMWLPMIMYRCCLVSATCADMSDGEVTKFAKQSGLVTLKAGELYSCARAKLVGVCALSTIAAQFCPVTCDLCKTPAAWTWLRTSNQFCLSSLQRCDPAARCGDLLASAEACHSAAVDLGLTANLTVLQVPPPVPRGCFVTSDGRTYFNKDGSVNSPFNFAKSLCRLKETTSAGASAA